ncbi:alpha/beta hydrolase [Streptomyces polyrhachis]|uniref:Alpha/beta hydrolase n=1 Tax=Streptomyces polyrhachis TaxID=1282885 RepID=A0ABW2GGD8_9ACTN
MQPSACARTTTARRLAAGAAVVVLAVTAAACGGSPDSPAGRGPTTTRAESALHSAAALDWKRCEPAPSQEAQGAGSLTWECATLPVPLDHARPDGEKIGIALIRTRAADPAHRIGSLVFNFGGPGGSGVETLPGTAHLFETLRTRYDLVSFDPRGVGASDGVRCLDDKQLDAYFAADNTPDDRSEERSYVRGVKDFNRACEKNAGTVLPYVGTEDAARDMDLMRAALGDGKLHYFGISYGTELGGVYAHLFPERVGRAVLDSAIDPTLDATHRSLAQAKGFQLALESYTEDCAAQGEVCPLGEDPREGAQKVAALIRRLDGEPFPGIGDRRLTQALATSGIAQALYSADFWPILSEALEEANTDDGRLLMVLGDALNGRDDKGRYSTLQSSFTAISCKDSSERPTPDEVRALLPEFRAASPAFGEFMAWSLLSCTDWAVQGTAKTPDVSAKGAAPIVVVGTTNDPATPFKGTERMVRALGPGVGYQLTHEGEGHGAYTGGSSCVRESVDAYLFDGTLPEKGATCR